MACIDCGPVRDASELPRSKWREHPNYPDQLLLLGSHEGFRSVSRRCIELSRAAEPSRGDITALFHRWHVLMRSHEAYEERKLYPYLARRYGTSLVHLARDHEALHALRDAVFVALADEDSGGVGRALERYDQELCTHLEREEAVVIPLLLDLPPDEFRRYYDAPSVEALLASMPACPAPQLGGH